MKPFSINTKGHFILFKEKEKQSLCKIKRAPKKPILKPFREEQQPTMGHSCMTTQTDQQSEDADRFPFIIPTVIYKKGGRRWGSFKVLWWMLFFKINMERREQRDSSIIYNLHIQLKTLTRRFCRQKKDKNHNGNNLRASRSRSNRCPNNKPYRVAGFHWGRGGGGLQPVCRSGQRGHTVVRILSGMGQWGGGAEWKSHNGRWFPLIDRHPGGRWPHTPAQTASPISTPY